MICEGSSTGVKTASAGILTRYGHMICPSISARFDVKNSLESGTSPWQRHHFAS